MYLSILSLSKYLIFILIFQVLELAISIYKQLPEKIDYDNTVKIFANDSSPLTVVLLQEVCHCFLFVISLL